LKIFYTKIIFYRGGGKISLCRICQSNPEFENGFCTYCNDVVFYLDDVINEFFKGTNSDQRIINALREFSWIYAGYPFLWGFYNSIINTIYYFIMNPEKTYITEGDLDYFDFTSLDRNDVLDVLFESQALKRPSSSSPGRFDMGNLSKILTIRIRDELSEDAERFKAAAEEMFGITSIILTNILIKKKLNNPEKRILPRKAISLFLTFAHIIKDNIESGKDIPSEFHKSLLDEQQKLICVSKNTQLKFMLELLGLTYISPGIPNIVSSVEHSRGTLKFKNNTINLLEYMRERLRERERERERI